MPERVPQADSAPRRRHGFTLVELLVALVIATLIAVAIVALYGTATRTVTDQAARARGPHAASAALDTLADDLARAILNAAVSNEFFVLEPDPASRPSEAPARLSFCTLDPAEGGDPDWTGTRRVTYRLESGDAQASALVRIHQPLTGPGSTDGALTNVIVPGATTFRVELFDGREWRSNWVGKAGDEVRPRSARVAVGSPAWPDQTAELFIPAGYSVTSSLIRQSGPAAP